MANGAFSSVTCPASHKMLGQRLGENAVLPGSIRLPSPRDLPFSSGIPCLCHCTPTSAAKDAGVLQTPASFAAPPSGTSGEVWKNQCVIVSLKPASLRSRA